MNKYLDKFNELLDPPTFENFKESLKFDKSLIKYINLINDLSSNGFDYNVVEGFNYQSDDEDVSKFNKIAIETNGKSIIYKYKDCFDIEENNYRFKDIVQFDNGMVIYDLIIK